jgi:predicted HTH domain antitoxin
MTQLGITVVDGSGDRQYNGSELTGGEVPTDPERGKEGGGMEKVVTVEIPEQWLQDLDWHEGAVMQEIIQLGTYQLKVRRALEMYQAGIGSLGYAAEKAGLSKRDLIREARARGIEPPFEEQTVREELGV